MVFAGRFEALPQAHDGPRDHHGPKDFFLDRAGASGAANLVVSRNPNAPATEGIEWFKSLDEAIDFARSAGETEAFIAGGTEIYSAALEKATRMYVTFVQRDFPFQGDTYFPMWDQTQWKAVSQERVGKDLEFVVYERSGEGAGQVVMEAGN